MKSATLEKFLINTKNYKRKLRRENIFLGALIVGSILVNWWQEIFQRHIPFHVIGDSHVFSFLNLKIKIHYLGPVTAYNLINKNTASLGREKLFNELGHIDKNKHQIILVFGEIDSRIHIYYQYMKKGKSESLTKLIKQTANNYLKVAEEISSKGYDTSIFNVIPAGEQPNIYGYKFYAPIKVRRKITDKFNTILKALCKKNNIKFIDIRKSLTDKKGGRINQYKLDRVHYNTIVGKLTLEYLNEKIFRA